MSLVERVGGRALALAAIGLGVGLLGRAAVRRARLENLRGQVAFVTGGSRGLGLLIARELGREGCRVAICARDEAELARAGDDLRRRGTEVLTVVCDVADPAAVGRAVEEIERRLGPVDVLVNNAGIIQVGPLENQTLQDFERAVGIMFFGALHPTLAVLPSMLSRRSGRIVNVTSIGGKVSVPHLLPYGCAKFAAVGLSEGLRAELAGTGVSVTTIVPGLMRTGSHLNALFRGQSSREFTWFSLGASLPFVSMDAERAARQIVRAAKRREAERILTLPANALARFHGLFPGLTADLLGIVNRLLLPPPDGGGPAEVRGMDAERAADSRTLSVLTTMGRSAARRFNESTEPTLNQGASGPSAP